MYGSIIPYAGLIVAVLGLMMAIKPAGRLGFRTRRRGATMAAVGIAVAVIGLSLPTSETRVERATSRLDEFTPAWQFNELHTIRIDAPPERVYAAVKAVRADEISLFNFLTWIRRFGRPLPESILNAGSNKPLLDVATQSGFIWLADDPPREVVIGTLINAPLRARQVLSPDFFRRPLPPGFTLAAMNFAVRADGTGGSLVSTETRVYANSASSQRQFAMYWRVIYPGSAIIRRMWLRAIARRATIADVSRNNRQEKERDSSLVTL